MYEGAECVVNHAARKECIVQVVCTVESLEYQPSRKNVKKGNGKKSEENTIFTVCFHFIAWLDRTKNTNNLNIAVFVTGPERSRLFVQ
jgi:hypothetical protein